VVKFAVGTFATDFGIDPLTLAKAVEERGFEALFFADHTHLPCNRVSKLRGLDIDLPEQYSHTIDPLIAMAAVAPVTSELKIGTGVCLVTERDPIVTAKQVASVDVVSGGRVIFGIGAGWNLEEMTNHGTDPATRFRLMRERTEAMKAIWTQDQAEYHGRFVDFDPIWQWPKPVQKPHPPVLVGGAGEHTLRRVVAYGDGWCPTWNPKRDWASRVVELRQLCDEAGRPPLPVTVFSTPGEAEIVEFLASLGIERCVFFLDATGEAESIDWLDRHAGLVRQLLKAGV
jgi:probable F420-dependent oxidoreductase